MFLLDLSMVTLLSCVVILAKKLVFSDLNSPNWEFSESTVTFKSSKLLHWFKVSFWILLTLAIARWNLSSERCVDDDGGALDLLVDEEEFYHVMICGTVVLGKFELIIGVKEKDADC